MSKPDLRFYTGRENYPPIPTEAETASESTDGLGCAECEGHLNDGCRTFCLACVGAREHAKDALLHRLWQINVTLEKAFKLAEDLQNPDLSSPINDVIQRFQIVSRLQAALSDARSYIPENMQAATPPEVEVKT